MEAPRSSGPISIQTITPTGKKSLVGMIMATKLDQDLPGDIKKAVKLVGGFEKSLKKTDKILIKPNMNTGDPWPQGGTDHAFLKALIIVLKDQGYNNITVADTCGPWGPTERVMQSAGPTMWHAKKPAPLSRPGKKKNG